MMYISLGWLLFGGLCLMAFGALCGVIVMAALQLAGQCERDIERRLDTWVGGE